MTGGLRISHARVTLEKRSILDDVSVEFRPGHVTAVIGPNGAGKSTLLGVGAGSVRLDAGEALLCGRNIRNTPAALAARLRAVMPQDSTVAFPFTAREVVTMGRAARSEGARRSEAIADEALVEKGLLDLADREITTLSGGERQRVAFARVLAQIAPANERTVLLLDEPTAAMDIAHAEATLSHARMLARTGAAVGVVLHDIDAAAAYADALVLMHRGRVHAVGTVTDVCDPAVLSRVYGTPIDVFERGGRLHVSPAREGAA